MQFFFGVESTIRKSSFGFPTNVFNLARQSIFLPADTLSNWAQKFRLLEWRTYVFRQWRPNFCLLWLLLSLFLQSGGGSYGGGNLIQACQIDVGRKDAQVWSQTLSRDGWQEMHYQSIKVEVRSTHIRTIGNHDENLKFWHGNPIGWGESDRAARYVENLLFLGNVLCWSPEARPTTQLPWEFTQFITYEYIHPKEWR
jgi:hypothetical protein